jgi:predicted DNA-binding transcriptional regulator YafY
MRGDQLSRQWKLVRLLSGPRGRTLRQLVAELGVVKRTVQRDMEALEAGGFPLVSDQRNGTVFWRFMDGFCADQMVSLTFDEMMALYFSRGLLQPLLGTPIHEAIDTALSKIGAAIPAQGHAFLRTVEEGIAVSTFGWKDFSHSRHVITALSKAVRNHFTAEIEHKTPEKKNYLLRRVDPYKVWYVNGGLYLIAWDYRAEQYLVFAIERVRSVKLTNTRFAERADFDFEKFQRTAFNMIWGEPKKVRLRFSKTQAPYVMERTWHTTQKFAEQPDGSVIMEMAVGDLWEVSRWLIGWGADAEVIEPPELARDVEDHARRIVARQAESDRAPSIPGKLGAAI